MTCGKDDPPGYTCGGGGSVPRPGCGRHFASLRAFDRHFVPTGKVDEEGYPVVRCAADAELKMMRFELRENLVWAEKGEEPGGD